MQSVLVETFDRPDFLSGRVAHSCYAGSRRLPIHMDRACAAQPNAAAKFRFGADRIEIWLRHWAVRRMHGPCEWASDAILRNNYARRGRKGSQDDRRSRQGRIASRSEGLDADQRAAMWLLPGGTDHASGGAIEQQKET